MERFVEIPLVFDGGGGARGLWTVRRWGILFCCLATCVAIAQDSRANLKLEQAAKALPGVVSLTIEPAAVLLHAANRQQQLLITGVDADGNVRDLTRVAEFFVADSAVAQIVASTIVGLSSG